MDRRQRRAAEAFARLPHELLVQIVSRCDRPTLAACAMTCRSLFRASHIRGRLGSSLVASSARTARSHGPGQGSGTIDLSQLSRPYGAIALLELLRSNAVLRNLRLTVRPLESPSQTRRIMFIL